MRGAAATFLLLCLSAGPVLAATTARDALTIRGDADRGRGIFNGLGGCYHCHGYDALKTRLPAHPPKLARELARLNPPPADLRDPARLKARTKPDRLRSLKSGHRGTAMFPKKFLTERELADLLAYLTTLRPVAVGSTPTGNVEQGRMLFNGKGICFYCHGQDGDPARLPELAPETAGIIARLDPKAPDLRQPGRLRRDRDRFRIIRDGHSGTGMLPDTRLTDTEIRHLLAYLATLQKQQR